MHTKRTNTSAPDGFALVVALLLLAFVLTLALSLTLLTRVEDAVSQIHLEQLRVREASRLSLMLALGQLQQYAGPDQRVTARAEILGDEKYHSHARYWTGVWDTTQMEDEPVWLVSGLAPAPDGLDQRTVQLVKGSRTNSEIDPRVRVPLIEIEGSGDRRIEIAWWIADEGVKASVAGPHPPSKFEDLEDTDLTPSQLQLARSFEIGDLFSKEESLPGDLDETLSKVHSLDQILIAELSNDSVDEALAGEAPQHALTLFSSGVLASTPDNSKAGLKRDLSLFPSLLGDGFENYMTLAEQNSEALQEKTEETERLRLISELRGLDDMSGLSDGAIEIPIAPILSNGMMAFTIRTRRSSDPKLYLRMRTFWELWNPYTSSLKLSDKDNNPMNLELHIHGLPIVTVEKEGNSAAVDLHTVIGDPSKTDTPLVIRLIHNHNEEWLPGMSKNWTGLDADELAGASPYDSVVTDSKQWNRNERTLGGSEGLNTGIELAGSGEIVLRGAPSSLKVELYIHTPATDELTLLSKLEGLEYENFITPSRTQTNKGMNFGYHFILRGPHQSQTDPEHFRGRWLRDHDHRNPSPTFHRDWNLDFDPSLSTGSPYVPVKDGIAQLAECFPHEITETNGSINTVIFRRLWDRSDRGSGGHGSHYNQLWQSAPLFELPRFRPLSLASLQHLYFHNERPFKVGNSWGSAGSINTLEWFDRYFFSGFSPNDDSEEYKAEHGPPHPLLIPFQFKEGHDLLRQWQSKTEDDSTIAHEPAAYLMRARQFNINSTSVAAWKLILSGLKIKDWEYLDYPSETDDLSDLRVAKETANRLFSRYSQSQAETYDAPAPPKFEGSEPVAPSAFYRRGTRRLGTTEIASLAEEIVKLLKQRKMPFGSMESFLSASGDDDQSLIEEAIKKVLAPSGEQQWDHLWETTGVRGDSGELIDVDKFSPGFLTQADIMTAIGPALASRSDTFRIRAHATSHHLLSERSFSATLEATVQRTPEPIEGARNEIGPQDRRFQIIGARWLQADER